MRRAPRGLPAPRCRSANGHAESLEVVLKNLVTNAIKFNRPQGTREHHDGVQPGQPPRAVSDTGIGIAKEDIPFVFEDFFRVKSSKTAEIPGTGLGLSIVKKLIEGHHGTVTVESKQGEGTTFTVVLPIIATGDAAAGPAD